jgi:hypothetical protein
VTLQIFRKIALYRRAYRVTTNGRTSVMALHLYGSINRTGQARSETLYRAIHGDLSDSVAAWTGRQ